MPITLTRRWIWLAVAAVVACTAPRAHAGFAHVVLNSSPGSYIGQGKNYDYMDNVSTARLDTNTPLANGMPTSVNFFEFLNPGVPGSNYTSLTFSTTQLGVALQVGTYQNAQRSAFATSGHAGLDVIFSGEGSNVLTGSFTITSISFSRNAQGAYQLDNFAASFDQTSDNNSSHVTGSITYSASVPEPSSLALAGFGCAVAIGAARRRRG